MSWVKIHGYKNPQYLLNLLLQQIKADVAEINQLPSGTRANTSYRVQRNENTDNSALLVSDHPMYGEQTVGEFAIVPDSFVRVLMDLRGGHDSRLDISAQYDTGAMEAEWSIEGKESTFSIEEVSRMILEPIVFD